MGNMETWQESAIFTDEFGMDIDRVLEYSVVAGKVGGYDAYIISIKSPVDGIEIKDIPLDKGLVDMYSHETRKALTYMTNSSRSNIMLTVAARERARIIGQYCIKCKFDSVCSKPKDSFYTELRQRGNIPTLKVLEIYEELRNVHRDGAMPRV